MPTIKALQARLHALEEEWTQELHRLREARGYHLEGRKIRIEAATRKLHRLARKGIFRYFWETRLSALVTGPLIWGAVIPALLLDLYVTLYQLVCFPIYGIPLVRRSDYTVLDRHHLPYLNWFESLCCLYCSYFNGMVAYTQEIAARTEQHYCPIKHARTPRTLHSRYRRFFDYGDAEAFRNQYETLRRDFADLRTRGPFTALSADPEDHPS